MVNSDLIQFFKVEYDKENVISSYPSQTTEEIVVWLNKAYNTIVSRVFSGNNTRQVSFEGDTKSISDLQGLVKTVVLSNGSQVNPIKNCVSFNITPQDFLYYVNAVVEFANGDILPTKLATHDITNKVAETAINKPWLPEPIVNIRDNNIIVYYDTLTNTTPVNKVTLTYVKAPNKISVTSAPVEVSDVLCNEIISLAVYYALENIESQRSQTKAQDIKLVE